MPNSYLEIAEVVLRSSKQPMTAPRILGFAQDLGIIPPHLFGATQHKTLAARLSEDIRNRPRTTKFYRTGPGEFFLRDLVSDSDLPEEEIAEFHAPIRRKQLGREDILCIPRDFFYSRLAIGFTPNWQQIVDAFKSEYAEYWVRRDAEQNPNLLQLVSYVVVRKQRYILSYRRGKFSNVNSQLLGARSVGFGGHVTSVDNDFWSISTLGALRNAQRELFEELSIETSQGSAKDIELFDIIGGIFQPDTPEGKKHCALVFRYDASRHRFDDLLEKGEMSINELSWLDLSCPLNDLSEFEPWSKTLLAIFYSDFAKSTSNN